MQNKFLKIILLLLLLGGIFDRPQSQAQNSPTPKSQSSQSPKSKLVFALFMPRFAGDTFWDLLAAFMQAACEDLGVKLEIHYAQGDAKRLAQLVEKAVSGPRPVDAVFFQNFQESAPQILAITSKAKVPTLLIDTSLNARDREKYGKPREKFLFWIGDFIPDNEDAGLDLALELIRQARAKGWTDAQGRLHLLALAGETDTGSASYPRVKGLKLAVFNSKQVVLHQVKPAFWQRELAAQTFSRMVQGFPFRPVILWAANDPMGLGAVDAGKKRQLLPGQTLLAGGIDWTADALKAIQARELAASVGGHFMLGGWGAILVHDYLKGIDFAEESVEMRLRMDILSSQNIDQYTRYFGQGQWGQIEFKKFSKVYQPNLKKYDFGLKAILQQFR